MLGRLIVAVVLVAGVLIPLTHMHDQTDAVTFDDSSPGRLVITAPYYQLDLSKANGAFLSIKDTRANVEISHGSNGGCLWGAVFATVPGYLGGCSYGSGANDFSYSWDNSSHVLTLRYRGSGNRLNADVTLTAGTSPSFDLRLTLENHTGGTVRNALFPSELLFSGRAVQAGYLPYYLPGVRVAPAYFRGDHPNVPTYPGGNAFADFLALDIAGSHFAMYSVNPAPNPIQPVAAGFIHNGDNGICQGPSFCSEHSFQTWVPDGGSWTSPAVRVVIGQSVAAAIMAYRRDNGIDRYPSVAEKLGSRFQRYARAPLIKADAAAIGKSFRDWIPAIAGLPSPALLHPVAYMRGGHDHSYPDFLPPDPAWGSDKEFAAMVRAAQAGGRLVMPYTNPTWWDDDSPTLHHLPAGLSVRDISVTDQNGNPVHETYGPNGGYDVSPDVPFVRKRLAEDMAQWRSVVPVDCVFEDQIGARPWLLDLNPAEPSPIAYSQGWLDHTARYASQCLMTENGWDRLAADEVGFNGSLLTWERAFHDPDQYFGAGNWAPFPLALWLLHDKVLLYQHDLALETMSDRPGVLTWNLAFGLMLSYNWDGSGRTWTKNRRLSLITYLQRDIAARFAGRPLTGFTTLAPNVTQTTFPGVRIIANWNRRGVVTIGGTGIAPNGFLSVTSDHTVIAGMVTGRFNGRPLSRGTHDIILEQGRRAITVRQPIGADTALSVDLPQKRSRRRQVIAYDPSGRRIRAVPFSHDGTRIRFVYRQKLGRTPVAFYRITGA